MVTLRLFVAGTPAGSIFARSLHQNSIRRTSSLSSPAYTSSSSIIEASKCPSLGPPSSDPGSTRTFSSGTDTFPTSTQQHRQAASFLTAIQTRRSRYTLNNKSTISDEQLEDILKTTVQCVPSNFNVQSSRYLVLLRDEHQKLWEIVTTLLQAHITTQTRAATEKKLEGYKKAYGTILFYEDRDAVDGLKPKFTKYIDHLAQWSEHTNAMNQFAVWTALDAEGMGANLQHYNPLIDHRVAEEWDVPLTWKLNGQLIFGGREGQDPDPKPKLSADGKIFIYGK